MIRRPPFRPETGDLLWCRLCRAGGCLSAFHVPPSKERRSIFRVSSVRSVDRVGEPARGMAPAAFVAELLLEEAQVR